MPDAQLTNVAGANGEGFSSGPLEQDIVNVTTTAIPQGTLVAIHTPITGSTTTIFGVGAATSVATTAPLNIGIAAPGPQSSGTSIAAAGSVGAAGGNGKAVTHGHVMALVDSTTSPTVVGHRLHHRGHHRRNPVRRRHDHGSRGRQLRSGARGRHHLHHGQRVPREHLVREDLTQPLL